MKRTTLMSAYSSIVPVIMYSIAGRALSWRRRRHHARLGRLEVRLVRPRVLLVLERLEHRPALLPADVQHERKHAEAERDAAHEHDDHDGQRAEAARGGGLRGLRRRRRLAEVREGSPVMRLT